MLKLNQGHTFVVEGVAVGGQLGGVTKLFFGSWHGMAKYFGCGWQIWGGGMRWHNILGGKVPKHFGGGVFRSPPTAAPCVTWM